MTNTRHVASIIALIILPIALFMFGFYGSMYRTFGSDEPLKNALKASNIYEAGSDEAIKTGARELQLIESLHIPASDPAVQSILAGAISPGYIQQQTEGVITSAFAWLKGQTNAMEFTVKLDEPRARIADGLGLYTTESLRELPSCQSLDAIIAARTDPLQAACLPPGIDPQSVGAGVRETILTNSTFLDEAAITTADITNSEGKRFEQQYPQLPEWYQQIQTGPYITAGVIIILILVVIFGAPTHWTGAKRLAVVLLTIGIITSLSMGVVINLAQQLTSNIGQGGDTNGFQEQLISVANTMVQGIGVTWLWYGIVFIAVGTTILIARGIALRRTEHIDDGTRYGTQNTAKQQFTAGEDKNDFVGKGKVT